VTKTNSSQFLAENEHFAIDGFKVSKSYSVTVTEMAPSIFRGLRQRYMTEA
jgi:hypothetical protein